MLFFSRCIACDPDLVLGDDFAWSAAARTARQPADWLTSSSVPARSTVRTSASACISWSSPPSSASTPCRSASGLPHPVRQHRPAHRDHPAVNRFTLGGPLRAMLWCATPDSPSPWAGVPLQRNLLRLFLLVRFTTCCATSNRPRNIGSISGDVPAGFGALELIAPIRPSPAVHLLYARHIRQPLAFIPHRRSSPPFTLFRPPYHDRLPMYFDAALPVTLWSYWASGRRRTSRVLDWRPVWLGMPGCPDRAWLRFSIRKNVALPCLSGVVPV